MPTIPTDKFAVVWALSSNTQKFGAFKIQQWIRVLHHLLLVVNPPLGCTKTCSLSRSFTERMNTLYMHRAIVIDRHKAAELIGVCHVTRSWTVCPRKQYACVGVRTCMCDVCIYLCVHMQAVCLTVLLELLFGRPRRTGPTNLITNAYYSQPAVPRLACQFAED